MEYAKKKNVTWHHFDKLAPGIDYSATLWVLKTSFFFGNADLLDFMDYMDETGGIYKYRWGEQTILPFALAMLLDFDQIYCIGDTNIEIFHKDFPYFSPCNCFFWTEDIDCCGTGKLDCCTEE